MIVENAGLEGSVVVNEVKNGGNRGGSDANGYSDYGYNARAEKYENLFKSGVIDPAKERESGGLLPRGSIAGMLLTILQCSKNFVPRLKCHRHFRICDIKEPVLWRRLVRQPAARRQPRHGWHGRHGRHGRYVLIRQEINK